MAQAKEGDKVRVHYTGTLADGSTFDSSVDADPFEFTLGENMVIPGFEEAVAGMSVGDKTTITLPPEEAYGEPNPDMINVVDRGNLPEGLEPEVGMMLQANADENTVLHVRVVEVADDTITVDANHPLAGKELTFELELMEIMQQAV